MLNKILVVDNNDHPIGNAPSEEVWSRGLWHRIVRVMVEDEHGRILLQKRSPQMDTFPNCWDHSAAGHVDEGESYNQAAQRELHEELGITAPVYKAAYYQTCNRFQNRQLNRFNTLYKAKIKSQIKLKLQKKEVSEIRWFTLNEIKKLIADCPNQATDGLRYVIAEYY